MNSALLLLGLAVQPVSVFMVKQEQEAPPAATSARQRFIRLTGHVSLSGTGHAPGSTGFATITVSGWTTLTDQDGRTLSGSIHLSDTQTYHLTGSNHVSGWARPSARVSVYRNGRYLGSVFVDGSIYVSGFNNNGWVNLSGSGYVQGSGTIEDPEEPQAP